MTRRQKIELPFEGPAVWAKFSGALGGRVRTPTSRLTGDRALRWGIAFARRHPVASVCVQVSPHLSVYIRDGGASVCSYKKENHNLARRRGSIASGDERTSKSEHQGEGT